jgi:hypothetical protein
MSRSDGLDSSSSSSAKVRISFWSWWLVGSIACAVCRPVCPHEWVPLDVDAFRTFVYQPRSPRTQAPREVWFCYPHDPAWPYTDPAEFRRLMGDPPPCVRDNVSGSALPRLYRSRLCLISSNKSGRWISLQRRRAACERSRRPNAGHSDRPGNRRAELTNVWRTEGRLIPVRKE